MMSICDQIERALDSVLDGLLNKTLRTVAWLVDLGSEQEVKPVTNLPDIVKDIHKASMPLRDFQPDLLPTPATINNSYTQDGLSKRCKSMNDICCDSNSSNTNNDRNSYSSCNASTTNTNKTFLNPSFDTSAIRQASPNSSRIPPIMYRQESYHGDSDIELQTPRDNKRQSPSKMHRQCHRCRSDPEQSTRTIVQNNNSTFICTTINSAKGSVQYSVDNSYSSTTVSSDNACLVESSQIQSLQIKIITEQPDPDYSQSETEFNMERERARLQRRSRYEDIIYRHFPEVRQTGELDVPAEEQEQLCHAIVTGLKTVADNFDAKHAGENGMSQVQSMAKLFLPGWQQIAPVVLKTSIDLALLYHKL